jgi:small subunit ribosomal protein S9
VAAKKKAEHAVGKRKTAIARVYMRAGDGKININGRDLVSYLNRPTARMMVLQPLELTNNVDKYDIYVRVVGGGLNGQAGAIRHGISRILALKDPAFRTTLKAHGLITRDPRKKERKLYGQKGARARFQFSKR